MRKTILLLVLIVLSFQSFSQQDSLLKQFKYRIDHFRAVSLNTSTGSQFDTKELGSGKQKNSTAGGGLDVYLNTIKSTDRLLLTTSSGFSTSFNSSKSENPGNTNKYRNFSITSQFNVLSKWFSGNSFRELGTDVSAGTNSNRTSSTAFPPSLNNRNTDYAATIHTGIGKGRLENITDMQNALWLTKALNEVTRLSRQLSDREMLELGRSITKGNNTRVLDARKRTQFILETADNYLQQKGLINKTDITYFTNLNDILFFAFNNFRLAGKEKFIRLSPSISGFNKTYDQVGSITRVEQDPVIKSALLSIGFNNYIPVNLKHQNNYGAALKISYANYRSTEKYFSSATVINEFNFNTTIKQAGINLFYQHAFYPNTRTNITLGLQSEAGYQDVESESKFYGQAAITGVLSYFISYRTRFNGSISADYRKNIYNTHQNLELYPDNLRLSVSAGISINL